MEVLAGFAIDHVNRKVFPALYGLGCLFTIVMGWGWVASSDNALLLFLFAFCIGFCVVGGQNAATALAALSYSAPVRTAGVGWSLGVGRLGGMLGPLIVTSISISATVVTAIACIGLAAAMIAAIVLIRISPLYDASKGPPGI